MLLKNPLLFPSNPFKSNEDNTAVSVESVGELFTGLEIVTLLFT